VVSMKQFNMAVEPCGGVVHHDRPSGQKHVMSGIIQNITLCGGNSSIFTC
jgi:hypothetical protein